MTVREKIEGAAWVRSAHSPAVAAKEIVAQEKVLTYYVKCAMEDHRTAVLNAAAMTAREREDIAFALKRIMEESVELASVLEGAGMTTVAALMADTYERKNQDYGDSFGGTMGLYGVVAGAVKNKAIIGPGIAVGLFGYAVGTYVGFLLAQLLLLI